MEYIICRKFNFNHIYFLFYALFRIPAYILKDYLPDKNEVAFHFFDFYLIILSRLISVIPYFINKKLSKSEKKEEGENEEIKDKEKIEFINKYNNEAKKLKKKLVKSTFILALFEFLAESCLTIFYFLSSSYSSYKMSILMTFNTVTQYLGSHFILHYPFYKHHYLSFGINFACSIIFLIYDIIELVINKVSQYQFYICFLIKMVKYILLSIKDNYSKRVLFQEYISTYGLMLFMGLYELLFLIIFSIPFIFVKTRDTNNIIFVDFLVFLKGKKLIMSIGLFISYFAYEIFLLIIIDKFSPSHLPLAFTLYIILNNIYIIIKDSLNNNENILHILLSFIVYAILLIAAMIHNEIIIINRCGLSKNTKMFLNIELDKETLDTIIPMDDESNKLENKVTMDDYMIPMEEIN